VTYSGYTVTQPTYSSGQYVQHSHPVASGSRVVEKPAPVVQKPAPVVQKPAPVVQKPAPVEKPAPVVQKPAPVEKPAPVVQKPAPVEKPAPVVEKPAPEQRPLVRTFRAEVPDHAILVLEVPEDAVVYLAGQKMSTTGTVRSFRVPLQDAEREYRYPVRLQFTREGKTLAANHTQPLVAGRTIVLRVDEDDLQKVTSIARR